MTVTIPQELKLSHIPRGLRPRCGAKTRSGAPCKAQALRTGLCAVHSGIITGGPSTPEAKERQADRARETMRRLWSTRWANGGQFLTDEGRARIAVAQKRRSARSRQHTEQTKAKIRAARVAALAAKGGAVAKEMY